MQIQTKITSTKTTNRNYWVMSHEVDQLINSLNSQLPTGGQQLTHWMTATRIIKQQPTWSMIQFPTPYQPNNLTSNLCLLSLSKVFNPFPCSESWETSRLLLFNRRPWFTTSCSSSRFLTNSPILMSITFRSDSSCWLPRISVTTWAFNFCNSVMRDLELNFIGNIHEDQMFVILSYT